jgi:large subunit ribosomal protein L5
MMPVSEKYKKKVILAMQEKFGYKNVMAVPKIEKVVLNTGFGRLIAGKTSDEQKKIRKSILRDMALVSGQAPVLTKARKAISAFKIREEMAIGAKVTLRGKRMYDFLDRLIHIVLPRSRDFKGISPDSVDKSGNLTLAIKEHISFPEVQPEKAKNIFGLEITVVTTARNKEEGLELFKSLGFPIQN